MTYTYTPDFSFLTDLLSYTSINGSYGILAMILVLLTAFVISRDWYHIRITTFPLLVFYNTMGIEIPIFFSIPALIVWAGSIISFKMIGNVAQGIDKATKEAIENIQYTGMRIKYAGLENGREAAKIAWKMKDEGKSAAIGISNLINKINTLDTKTAQGLIDSKLTNTDLKLYKNNKKYLDTKIEPLKQAENRTQIELKKLQQAKNTELSIKNNMKEKERLQKETAKELKMNRERSHKNAVSFAKTNAWKQLEHQKNTILSEMVFNAKNPFVLNELRNAKKEIDIKMNKFKFGQEGYKRK